jgi:hypothetical protein
MNYRHLIAYLGQNRKIQDSDLVNITGFENYTPYVLKSLKAMFDNGLIKSYPRLVNNGYTTVSIDWRTDHPSKDNPISKAGGGERHRDNGLPATEYPDASYVGYAINGKYHRVDGPARAWDTPIKMAIWSRADRPGIPEAKQSTYKFYLGGMNATKEEFEKFIRENYPEAGDKIFIEDYVS